MRRGGKVLLRAKHFGISSHILRETHLCIEKYSAASSLNENVHSTVYVRLMSSVIKFKRADYETSAAVSYRQIKRAKAALKSIQAPSHHALIAVLTASCPPFASNLKTRALILQKARVFGAVGFVLIARRQFAPQTLL